MQEKDDEIRDTHRSITLQVKKKIREIAIDRLRNLLRGRRTYGTGRGGEIVVEVDASFLLLGAIDVKRYAMERV